MKYLNALKGGVIAFIFFFVAALLIPSYGPSNDVEILLTVSTFLFAILAGFFIARLSSRYNQIRDLLATEDANFLSFYETSKLFGKTFQKKVGEIIERYYILVYDHLDLVDYYKATSKELNRLYDELNKIKNKKYGLADNSFDDMLVTLGEIEKNRNLASEMMGEKLSKGYWSILFLLSSIIIFSVFFLKVDQLYSQLITIFLSSIIILVLLVMRDLQNLRLGKNPVATESGQEIFDFMGKLRYYNEKDIKSNYITIPKALKKYRIGLHKPGEKFKIKTIKVK